MKDRNSNRAFILVLDGFGIGAAPDADKFGDPGADTLGHIASSCSRGQADRAGERSGPLKIPFMESLGLGEAAKLASGRLPEGFKQQASPLARFAACREISHGKDTSSGHWEIAGAPVLFDWDYFPEAPSFPARLIELLLKQSGIPGILGNCHASGTEIIQELGEEHVKTGKPICYTSIDSVFQVAAHEKSFGLARLHQLCSQARGILDKEGLNIARVIARPFIGTAGNFIRTPNRKDYSVPPPRETLLDRLTARNHQVYGIGKISEIFSGRGITKSLKAADNDGNFRLTDTLATEAEPGSLVFTNFVDFDMLYGHRRDTAGYACALEKLDRQLAGLSEKLGPGDLAVITADHGCDPAFRGSNHTREYVPALFFGPGVKPGSAGIRDSFSDIGQTIASHLGIPPLSFGKSVPWTSNPKVPRASCPWS